MARLLVSALALWQWPVASALNIAITGTSQGIGLSAARRLVLDGHTVIHACRTAESADAAVAAAGGGVPMVCDLADLKSVKAFAEAMPTDVDVLCLNAGVAPSTKAAEATFTADGFEVCVGTNHLGHFALAQLAAPALEKRGGLFVVTASSVHDPLQPGGDVGGKGGATLGDLSGFFGKKTGSAMVDGGAYDGGKAYKDSKLANVLFLVEAQKRFGGKVRVRAFNPGFIPASGLFREPRKDNFVFATAFTAIATLAGLAVPVDVGGARLAYMATAPDSEVPPGSYLSAKTGSKGVTVADGFEPAAVSAEAADAALAAKLWDASAAAVSAEIGAAPVAGKLSMAGLKKFGAAGTLAYILTELAFWAAAFPAAAAALYNTQGHWPDFADNGDRAAVLGFVFAGANVARLAVPLRFGVAFAVAPWVDANIIQRFQKPDAAEI
ncbi:hypothetical protein M885DRAFT_540997 [Pelagophyceae sp. CCMP2097]|nr:hypothetical protein M885DRAFT_540997 [Pelagophyceae sp. CCMP2097]